MVTMQIINENHVLQIDRHFLNFYHVNRRHRDSNAAFEITKIGIRTLSPTVPTDAM